MKESLRILKDEHRSLSAVLSGLRHLTRLAGDPAVKPDFAVFRAMIRYIDEYPERQHHPKEDEFLFARLRVACAGAAPLIEELEREHERGAKLVRELERALVFFEDAWPDGWLPFSDQVEAYADFHWEHMTKEEEKLFPLAERYFSEEDWKVVDAGFASNRDPIAHIRGRDFEELFTKIVNLAPAPIGLAEPWKRSAA